MLFLFKALEYGTKLLKKLEERVNRKGLTTTMFKWARKFYRLYPQMAENLPTLISKTMSCKFAEQKSVTVMHQFVTPGKMRSFHMKTLGNSMRMYPIIRKMKCTPVITHLSEFCSVLGRERKWWNMLLQVWTINFLFLLTCSNCQTRKPWKISS